MKIKQYAFVFCLLPLMASAEITPPKGQSDPRVRTLIYNPTDVVIIRTFYGVSTHIDFGTETIRDLAAGDDLAWKLVPRGSNLFLKPVTTNADTNLTVVTDKRTYQFALKLIPRKVKDTTAWTSDNLVYSLKFRYLEDEAAAARVEAEKRGITLRLDNMRNTLGGALRAAGNSDYWFAGDNEVSPTQARDDGRFIHLSFENNRDMPAVYEIDEGGKESLVNTNVIDGNTIVVQHLSQSLILRRGNFVGKVVNKSFNPTAGREPTSGTVSPNVVRTLKREHSQ